MNLDEIAARASQNVVEPRGAAAGLWDRAHNILRSEERTDPYVAALLTQILILSDEFDDTLLRRGLDPRDTSGRETILIPRPGGSGFVLLIADAALNNIPEPEEENVTVGRSAFGRALGRWRQLTDARTRIASRRDERWSEEARRLEEGTASLTERDFDSRALANASVMFVERPQIIPTSCPNPAWEVRPLAWHGPHAPRGPLWGVATAGCLVQHDNGKWGVTCVRHLFAGASMLGGMPVDVGGTIGRVAAEDAVTDSVFIEMPQRPSPANASGIGGYLSGVAPRGNEPVRFDGATSGPQTTAIQAIDPTVTYISAICQSKVYTPAVTNPGDSGAALVEQAGTDRIIAFAHERTPPGAALEWSTWIWAACVFNALKVKPS